MGLLDDAISLPVVGCSPVVADVEQLAGDLSKRRDELGSLIRGNLLRNSKLADPAREKGSCAVFRLGAAQGNHLKLTGSSIHDSEQVVEPL